ncbi:MAG: phosphotransferase, partial [Actinomycetaceae bacterium]|nr:phosphotransferase [Actinomycetaceae bacterium]
SLHSLHHRPGAGVTVGYSVSVDRIGQHGELKRSEEYICASTAQLSDVDTSRLVYMKYDGMRVVLWRYPEDPELPALMIATSPGRMSTVLDTPVNVDLKSYRPTRRAVVKISDSSGQVLYGKVMRPHQARDLSSRHEMLARSGVCAPRVVLFDERGLVLLSHAQGEPLANFFSRGMGDAAERMLNSLENVLDSFPSQVLSLPRRAAWADRPRQYAHAASTAIPEAAARCKSVALGIESLMKHVDLGPLVPTHGDFYEANIYVDSTRAKVTSIIDIDSLGPGYRVDDWACLLGHMSVLPSLAPQAYPHVRADLMRWIELLEDKVDPLALSVRTSGVVLSLIAGAKRVDGKKWRTDALQRLEIAEWWLARARMWAAQS